MSNYFSYFFKAAISHITFIPYQTFRRCELSMEGRLPMRIYFVFPMLKIRSNDH